MKELRIHVLMVVALIGLLFFLLYQIAHAPVPEGEDMPVACTMEAKICPDGSAVGRVGPSCEFAACPEPVIDEELQARIDAKADLLILQQPAPFATVASPIVVRGQARGYWFFEATAPVTVVNWDGLIIGEGYIEAVGEWMTEDFVPFTGTITYTLPADSYSTRGALILKKSNASGLPEHDDALEIPITLVPTTQ
jgi:Immunoglobulin-like domain of bacterial spore germination